MPRIKDRIDSRRDLHLAKGPGLVCCLVSPVSGRVLIRQTDLSPFVFIFGKEYKSWSYCRVVMLEFKVFSFYLFKLSVPIFHYEKFQIIGKFK